MLTDLLYDDDGDDVAVVYIPDKARFLEKTKTVTVKMLMWKVVINGKCHVLLLGTVPYLNYIYTFI